MKTHTFRLLSIAGLAASALAVAAPALAHDGYWGGRHPGHRVVVVRPVFAPAPVVVYRPYPVYYAPAPVVYAAPAPVYYAPGYAPNAVGTIGGAIAGAAIGGIASHGRPGAIAAGSVIGAVVGSTLPR
jgi:hypothetical protein